MRGGVAFDTRRFMQLLRFWVLAAIGGLALMLCGRAEQAPAADAPAAPALEQTTPPPTALGENTLSETPSGRARVKVIPVRDPIAKPVLYVIRRGLKEAQAEGMRSVVLDMETPGGELGVTLEIMEALDRFEGETLVYVNKEAISAGAIISSVVDEIHFAPGGVIGAAAAVSGGGAEVPETMKQKINSYLNAKVRSFNDGEGFRAEVIRAMMDADYELKIGEEVIKPKGELLSLTAREAARTFGDPPLPLLSSGTHDTLEDLLASEYGEDNYEVSRMEVTWSERLASWLNRISPLLMGAGLLCVFVEFKTPGFGIFGVAGGILLAIVFFGHYTAGLSGHEAALVFVVGVALVAVEIFVVPGTLVAGIAGAALMLGALVWSMADVWPGEMPELDGDLLLVPLLNVAAALAIAVIGGFSLARFLPSGWFWDRMILQASVAGDAGAPDEGMGGIGAATEAPGVVGDAWLGLRGRTVSVLRPMGEVEIQGRRHEARAALGSIERDEIVRVTGRSGRVLIVERDVA